MTVGCVVDQSVAAVHDRGGSLAHFVIDFVIDSVLTESIVSTVLTFDVGLELIVFCVRS